MINETTLTDPRLPDTAEVTFGAREQLAGCLDSCRKLNQEVADYEKACALAEEDEAGLLEDRESDEEELVLKLAKVHARKKVHEKRAAARQADLKTAQAKLETVLTAASNQLRGECLTVLEQNRAALAESLLELLGLPFTRPLPPGIWQSVGLSPRIRAIESCQPRDANALGHVPVAERAADVLARFDKLSEAKGGNAI
jgi:hypothetical protein